MRIRLADEAKGQRGRGKDRKRRKGRRSRTFETTLALPQAQRGQVRSKGKGRQAPQEGRPSARRGVRGKGKADSAAVADSQRRPAGREAAAPLAEAAGTAERTRRLRAPIVLLLALLIAGGVYGSSDARFFVYEADIRGAQHLGKEAIYQAAGIHEQNIFWIDPAEVARRLVQIDGVKVARVRCELPAGVTIDVEEREPQVLWRVLAQQRDWWVDEAGVVLPYHGDVGAAQTVFVVDSSERQLDVGQRVEPQGTVDSVLKLAAALPGTRIFFYEAGRGLSFTQKVEGGEWPVYVGSSEDLARKIQVMQALTAYFQSSGIRPRYVDVRWAAHPVYGRPAGETTGGGQ